MRCADKKDNEVDDNFLNSLNFFLLSSMILIMLEPFLVPKDFNWVLMAMVVDENKKIKFAHVCFAHVCFAHFFTNLIIHAFGFFFAHARNLFERPVYRRLYAV